MTIELIYRRFFKAGSAIEQVFAKIKALLRKADARSIKEVDAALGALLDEFEADEFASYFREAGYRSTSVERALATVVSHLGLPVGRLFELCEFAVTSPSRSSFLLLQPG